MVVWQGSRASALWPSGHNYPVIGWTHQLPEPYNTTQKVQFALESEPSVRPGACKDTSTGV